METLVFGLTLASLAIWIGLLVFRGQFWRSNVQLTPMALSLNRFPSVCAIVPARNEAAMLPKTLRSLLLQENTGAFRVVLVDDRSTDNTAEIAKSIAEDLQAAAREHHVKVPQLDIITAQPLPDGWTGKLWAMEQGVRHAQRYAPDYYLFTDADIEHERHNLEQLVLKAEREQLDLASLMVRLRCRSFWERFLIPPFIYFFEKLYPFTWANDLQSSTAAAAGGCILLRRHALQRIGGLEAIKNTLIDDCSLAKAIKIGDDGKRHPIWIGLAEKTRSLRPYPSLWSIWNMVARTAYTQLNHSPILLVLTVVGMALTYWVPVVGLVWGIVHDARTLALVGLAGWLLMAFSLLPTLRLYRQPPFLGLFLPIIALLYVLMTLDSAVRHLFGRGGNWKGRVYSQS